MSNTEIKGILGNKLGMTQIFDDETGCTCYCRQGWALCRPQVRTEETDGYNAVQIAAGVIDRAKLPSLWLVTLKAGVMPRRHIVEIRLKDADAAANYEVGQELTADISKLAHTLTSPEPLG